MIKNDINVEFLMSSTEQMIFVWPIHFFNKCYQGKIDKVTGFFSTLLVFEKEREMQCF